MIYCNINECKNWLPLQEVHLMKNKKSSVKNRNVPKKGTANLGGDRHALGAYRCEHDRRAIHDPGIQGPGGRRGRPRR